MGMTSTAVVAVVKRVTDATKVGHAGTLDPLASGVLPVALGEATKTVPHVVSGAKQYQFTICWGQERSTDDAEGDVIRTSPRRPTAAEIRAALPSFIGRIEQVPPAFSAIRVAGERAYDLARAGRCVGLPSRTVEIHRLALVGVPDVDHALFEMDCGKGTYVRSVARDLARALGSAGHISQLHRTVAGPFTEAHAISLETLQTIGHSVFASGYLLPVEAALEDIPALALTDVEATRLRCGRAIALMHQCDAARVRHLESGVLVRAISAGKTVALARFESGELRPVRVLNT
jgi:tRNA pseudouridine55 synthase